MTDNPKGVDYRLMSEFITHSKYAQFEHLHAGWRGAVRLIAYVTSEFLGATSSRRIVEFGCGPGTSTCHLVRELRTVWQRSSFAIDALDNDPQSIAVLDQAARELGYSEARAAQTDALAYLSHASYDAFLAVFALSHLRPNHQAELLKRLPSVSQSGFGVVADEFIPAGQPSAEAYWTHHSAVIFDALVKGNVDLAVLELQALHSGVHGIGDFKFTTNAFETELNAAELVWRRVQLFPLHKHLLPDGRGGSELEVAARGIWAQKAPTLRGLVEMPPETGSVVPRMEAVGELRDIFDALRNAGCTRLRDNDMECALPRDHDVADEAGGLRSPWGVYVYAFANRVSDARLQKAVEASLARA